MTIKENIESFRHLKEGWNCYGSKAIPEKVIKRALEFEQMMDEETVEVFPTARESIQFETKSDKRYVEIEIFEDHVECFFLSEESKEPTNDK